MFDSSKLRRIYSMCDPAHGDPAADPGWAELYGLGLAVASAALEEAAILVELEYAADEKGHARLRQIAQHVRGLKPVERGDSNE